MKVLRSVLVLALVLGFVGGVAASPKSTAAQDTVTINWWHIQTIDTQVAFWEEVVAEYEAAHPNVNIEMTGLENEAFKSQIVTVMQAGDPPDLFQSWGGGVLWQYADAGMVRNIAPELEGEWYDSFAVPAAVEMFGRDGEYYGVPWTWGAVGFFYNKALLAQVGYDTFPTTWTDFLACVQALKDAGITPIALGEGDRWPGHFWWVYLATRLGGQDAFVNAYTREGTFADEPFVKAGEYLQQLAELEPFQEGFMSATYGDEAGLVGDGQAAMELMGQWAAATQVDNSEQGGIGEDLAFAPFPMIEEGAGDPTDILGGGDGYAVGANAPDETIDFLRYITSEDVQRRGAAIGFIVPTVKNAADELVAADPIMAQIIEMRDSANYAQLYYDQFLPASVAQAVLDSVQGLLAGEISPEEAAQYIEDEAAFALES
jgi:raffinose/stachyose/melibiose transport system substrate-binding protein